MEKKYKFCTNKIEKKYIHITRDGSSHLTMGDSALTWIKGRPYLSLATTSYGLV